jgi:hypothetical protein
MEPEGSLPCWQDPPTGPHPEPVSDVAGPEMYSYLALIKLEHDLLESVSLEGSRTISLSHACVRAHIMGEWHHSVW